MPWTVEGGDFGVGYRNKAVQDLLTEISVKAKPILGLFLFCPDPLIRFRIVSATEDVIELEHPSFGQATLRRVPE